MRKFYSQFLSPGDLCFDVGANIGNKTKAFLDLNAHVVAIEPQQECVRQLHEQFGYRPDLDIEAVALGASDQTAEMMIGESSVLSTLSTAWLESVRASGRFREHKWITTREVPVTTLDALIRRYGIPQFVKIDVEGYEWEVLQGLSRPLPCISIEITAEYIHRAVACIDYLAKVAPVCLNRSKAESMELALNKWVTPSKMKEQLAQCARDPKFWGDLYIRAET